MLLVIPRAEPDQYERRTSIKGTEGACRNPANRCVLMCGYSSPRSGYGVLMFLADEQLKGEPAGVSNVDP